MSGVIEQINNSPLKGYWFIWLVILFLIELTLGSFE